MEKKEYQEYVKKHAPKTKMLKTLIPAFIVGGCICMIGQLVNDLFHIWFPDLTKKDLGTITSMVMIFLGAFLTGLGVYDRIGRIAGAGSIIPITGFANSIVSPAMEFKHEGVVFGVCSRMFVIAGPIIVIGIVSSVLVGLIGMFFV